MKRIIRVSQKQLHELLMKETGDSFLSGTYRNAPEEKDVPAEPAKINISFTEEQINFLEDVL